MAEAIKEYERFLDDHIQNKNDPVVVISLDEPNTNNFIYKEDSSMGIDERSLS